MLAQIDGLGTTPVNEVARHLVMDRTTLTRNLKPLQQEALVKQEPNPTDKARPMTGSRTRPSAGVAF